MKFFLEVRPDNLAQRSFFFNFQVGSIRCVFEKNYPCFPARVKKLRIAGSLKLRDNVTVPVGIERESWRTRRYLNQKIIFFLSLSQRPPKCNVVKTKMTFCVPFKISSVETIRKKLVSKKKNNILILADRYLPLIYMLHPCTIAVLVLAILGLGRRRLIGKICVSQLSFFPSNVMISR